MLPIWNLIPLDLEHSGGYTPSLRKVGQASFSHSAEGQLIRNQTRILNHWQDTAGQDVIGSDVAAVPIDAPDSFKVIQAQSIPTGTTVVPTGATLTLLPLREAITAAIARVREGGSLSRALAESGRFPPLLTRLVASGEKSGDLEPMLDHAADLQEKQVQGALGAFVAILEPLLVVAMGALVLFMVLAILLPIFELNRIIGK